MRAKHAQVYHPICFLENMNGAMGRLGEYLELVLQCAINRVS
jgi:hypothetical protein